MKEQLKDINPFIINDNFFYIKIILIIIVVIILVIVLFKFARKKIVKFNLQKQYIQELKLLHWDDVKDTSLKIKSIGDKLILTNESYKIYHDLLISLKMYKFKKNIPMVSDKTIIKYNLFIEILEDEQF